MNHHEIEQQNTQDWNNILKSIFGGSVPAEYTWTDTNDIISVLNKIGSVQSSNKIHLPGHGSDVLLGATSSNEKGCIELNLDGPYVIRVKSLTFFSANRDLDWNYFRIGNENLQPSGACSTVSIHPNYDHLVELTPTFYIDGKYWDEVEFGSDGLPETARHLSRILKGDLVIFKDTSVYNQFSHSDDGRHARMSSEEFKSYMTDMYNAFH